MGASKGLGCDSPGRSTDASSGTASASPADSPSPSRAISEQEGRLAPADGYSPWAHVYDAIYGWKDYQHEAQQITEIIRTHVPQARTLLDVACGTGVHLELLSKDYEVAGLDRDPEMLAVAKQRLKGVELVEGDMRSFRLDRSFDVVTCLFSSIAHMLSEKDLSQAIRAMASHLASPGVLIVEPFHQRHEWITSSIHSLVVDDPDLKIARFTRSLLEEPDMAVLDMHLLIGTPEGIEHHVMEIRLAMHPHDRYRTQMEQAGLEVFLDPEGLMGRGLFVGVKR